jgi:hypothetical protein
MPECGRQGPNNAGADRNEDRAGRENGSMEKDGVWKQKTANEGNDLIREGVARLGGYDDA